MRRPPARRDPLLLAARQVGEPSAALLLEPDGRQSERRSARGLVRLYPPDRQARARRSLRAVRNGVRPGSWPTRATFAARNTARASRSRRARSWPSTSARPVLGCSSPASRCRSVVLPEPEGPVTATSVPLANSASRPASGGRGGRASPVRLPEPAARGDERAGACSRKRRAASVVGRRFVGGRARRRCRPRAAGCGARAIPVLRRSSSESRSQPPRPTTMVSSPPASSAASSLTRPSRTRTMRSAIPTDSGRG